MRMLRDERILLADSAESLAAKMCQLLVELPGVAQPPDDIAFDAAKMTKFFETMTGVPTASADRSFDNRFTSNSVWIVSFDSPTAALVAHKIFYNLGGLTTLLTQLHGAFSINGRVIDKELAWFRISKKTVPAVQNFRVSDLREDKKPRQRVAEIQTLSEPVQQRPNLWVPLREPLYSSAYYAFGKLGYPAPCAPAPPEAVPQHEPEPVPAEANAQLQYNPQMDINFPQYYGDPVGYGPAYYAPHTHTHTS